MAGNERREKTEEGEGKSPPESKKKGEKEKGVSLLTFKNMMNS